MTLDRLIPTLQFSIGPVILISGVGLILLSMTNRFGRIIERSRLFTRELHGASNEDRARIIAQLKILSRRARYVRMGIIMAALSVVWTSLLIISLFLGTLFGLQIVVLVVVLFTASMVSLIASMYFFIAEINLSLKALWLEIPREARRDS